MSKKLFEITVHGKSKTWGFLFDGEEKYLQDWVNDGLDVSRVENIIPEWVVNAGLIKIWCFLQDIFQFR